MKVSRRQLRKVIAELSFTKDHAYESERWQQEHLNKVQLEDKLEQIQQDLAPEGVELVVLTDDESGSLADNEIKVIIKRKKSGIMGMLGSEDSQVLMFYAWPNGISVKDADSGEDPISLTPAQVDGWLQTNIVKENLVESQKRIKENKMRISKRQLKKIILQEIRRLDEDTIDTELDNLHKNIKDDIDHIKDLKDDIKDDHEEEMRAEKKKHESLKRRLRKIVREHTRTKRRR